MDANATAILIALISAIGTILTLVLQQRQKQRGEDATAAESLSDAASNTVRFLQSENARLAAENKELREENRILRNGKGKALDTPSVKGGK